MTRRDDSDEIANGLAARIEDVLDWLAPGYVIHRGKAFLTAKGPKQLGSFQVNLEGPHRGTFYRFSQSVGGGPIKLAAYLLNGQAGEPSTADYRLAFHEARRFLGMDDRAVDDETARRAREKARADSERRRGEAEAEAQAERERKQERADWLWEHAEPLPGTPAERYLHKRGIHLEVWPTCLRFAQSIRHPSGAWSPAMLCRVDGPAGEFRGVWRIFITIDGEKGFGGQSKQGLGPTGGGAVRLFGPDRGRVAVCEGVEAAFGVHLLTGLPVWSLLSTSGMTGFEVPMQIGHVDIFEDGDTWAEKVDKRTGRERISPPPGPSAAEQLFRRLREEGVEVTRQAGPEDGSDYLDIWRFMQKVSGEMALA
ncbi:DUF7146 domain-containing protein [Acuticoccus kandeliae]|uniref:DUF7146 domain-containing protein n=1 Tax=Acuticoccus kandeliae TaxID=2073160 RepID=UPI000D3ED948|nr:toprim domain-containing protein [Acuticoccus kandeliae]